MKHRPLLCLNVLAAALMLIAVPTARAQVRPDTPANPFGADPVAVVEGKRMFDAACTVCHGPGGVGTERAPALDTGRFTHGGEDFDVFQTIQKGVQGTQMPSFGTFSAERIWQLVSYVRSLSRTTSATASAPVATGDASRGEQLFFGAGQCSSCHEVNGRGRPLAADLSAIGVQPLESIQAGIEHRQTLRRIGFGPNQRHVEVTLQDGTQLQGLLKNEDSFAVVLQELEGGYRLLDRRRIRTIANSKRTLTPDAAQRPSAEQAADLLAYLSHQKQRATVPLAGTSDGHDLTFDRLMHAEREPQNWLTYWGSYRSEHFTELTQINRRNVSTLQAKWAVPLPGNSPVESTPLVVDGVMYVSGPPGDVYALDARSGLQIWKFHRQQDPPKSVQLNPYNRGVAILGKRIFLTTLDNDLIALDARSGRVLWEHRIADAADGYSMTGAPLALDNKIIVGISGGEMGVRGFLDAYDVNDGHRLWRFETIPGPGQPGHDTWSGDSWKTGSGATWLTGSYDAQLHQLYWAVGNPGPDFDATHRDGDNLYSCSVVALNPDTGRLIWFYQISPHDTHDWDPAEDFILAEETLDGHPRKVLLHADRNGFFYTLDRVTGRFISAVPFVRQSWNKGFEPNGRPIVDPDSLPSPQGHRIWPGVGGTNFQSPSYDPVRNVLFLNFLDSEWTASSQAVQYQRGQIFTGAHFSVRLPPVSEPSQGVMALDARTGSKLWTLPVSRPSLAAGVLATRGEVVFAATAEGNLLGIDGRTGQSLWHFQTGVPIVAAPMSYAVEGTQFVAVAAGNTLYSFALPDGQPDAPAPAAATPAAASVPAAAPDTLLIEAIDVEGGGATLYITPEHKSLLIDSGWPADIGAKDPDSAQRIIAAARRRGLSKIDTVLITHYHVDHVGGLSQLLGQFPVGTILDHGPNREVPPPDANPAFAAFQPATLYPKYLEAIRGHKHRSLKPGDTLDIGSLHMTVVTSDGGTIGRAPPGAGGAIAECDNMSSLDQNGGEENARSVGVVLTFGHWRIASFGDLTWNVEKALVCPRDKVGPVDLFFVSNHGTHLNNSPALLHALEPRIAIVGNGAKKGADPETYETVSGSPRLERLWQLHRAERTDAQHNAPEAYIANPAGENDSHASLEVQIARHGALTVTNNRTSFSEAYPQR